VESAVNPFALLEIMFKPGGVNPALGQARALMKMGSYGKALIYFMYSKGDVSEGWQSFVDYLSTESNALRFFKESVTVLMASGSNSLTRDFGGLVAGVGISAAIVLVFSTILSAIGYQSSLGEHSYSAESGNSAKGLTESGGDSKVVRMSETVFKDISDSLQNHGLLSTEGIADLGNVLAIPINVTRSALMELGKMGENSDLTNMTKRFSLDYSEDANKYLSLNSVALRIKLESGAKKLLLLTDEIVITTARKAGEVINIGIKAAKNAVSFFGSIA
jgi:hypothetical protein